MRGSLLPTTTAPALTLKWVSNMISDDCKSFEIITFILIGAVIQAFLVLLLAPVFGRSTDHVQLFFNLFQISYFNFLNPVQLYLSTRQRSLQWPSSSSPFLPRRMFWPLWALAGILWWVLPSAEVGGCWSRCGGRSLEWRGDCHQCWCQFRIGGWRGVRRTSGRSWGQVSQFDGVFLTNISPPFPGAESLWEFCWCQCSVSIDVELHEIKISLSS